MQLSVVVPVYNGEPTLALLLRSLANQACEERYEVIVADDGSTDASVAIARSFASDISLVICESGAHRGASAARNAGAARASAQVLAFCDHDDIVDEGWVRSICARTRRDRLVAGAVHRLSADVGDGSGSATTSERMDPDALTAFYGHLPWSVTANLAVRADVFAELGGFAEELAWAHDADLCWRLAGRGVPLVYEPAAIVYKRPRDGAMPTFRQYLRYGLDHPLLFRMHRHSGMPRRDLRATARRYAGTALTIARGLGHPRSPVAIPAAARSGQDIGRLIGSVRWRSLYL